MAILHYRLSRLAKHWVLPCECAPIELFDERPAALSAAIAVATAAEQRGDNAILIVDEHHANAAAARSS